MRMPVPTTFGHGHTPPNERACLNPENPILLFGMPRSGTTWLGKIFDSHPDTLYRHEPDSRGSLNAIPLFPLSQDVGRYRDFLLDYVARLPDSRDEKISASLPVFGKRYYSPAALMTRKFLVIGSKAVSRFLGPVSVPDTADHRRHPGLRVVWKSIESLGRLGVLAKALPHSRGIIILRHPCGYVASVLRGEDRRKFECGTPSSEDWDLFNMLLELAPARSRGLTLPEVQAMTEPERLALKWALSYEHALHETEGLENVVAVRYEDFCAHPLDETRKAFAHCGLPWAEETARFIDDSTARENAEYYSVFKNPQASALKWRQELAQSDVDGILRVVSHYSAGRWYASGQ